MGDTLASAFLSTLAVSPDHVALVTRDATSTYAELAQRAGAIARLLAERERPTPLLGAVLGAATHAHYQGILGTVLSGAGYVPLNPKFPIERTAYMLRASRAVTLVVDRPSIPLLPSLLATISDPLLVVAPDVPAAELPTIDPHTFVGREQIDAARPLLELPAAPLAERWGVELAYLLFTSGTTGSPKGVMVTHANVLHHLTVMQRRYALGPGHRFAQMFDTTFDLSAFGMFLSWRHGAALHVPSDKDLMLPAHFIKHGEITHWYSVPSVGALMQRLGMLKPGSYPSLTVSLFCGEPLPMSVARAWQEAAPHSRVENLYGPTEVTIACTGFRVDEAAVDIPPESIVPIGAPLEGMEAALVDEHLARAAPGEAGELCFRGPQVCPGYWADEERTAARFVAMPWYTGPDNRWYRTGDRAAYGRGGRLEFRGRADEQLKIRGFRVELLEIEAVLRAASGSDQVAVVPFPRDAIGATGLTAFVAQARAPLDAIKEGLRAKLTEYMIPQTIHLETELPLNANGKIDKNALLARLMKA